MDGNIPIILALWNLDFAKQVGEKVLLGYSELSVGIHFPEANWLE